MQCLYFLQKSVSLKNPFDLSHCFITLKGEWSLSPIDSMQVQSLLVQKRAQGRDGKFLIHVISDTLQHLKCYKENHN